MTIFPYLQLQPVDPQDDGSTSDLDEYQQDETIDLQSDITEQQLDNAWEKIITDLEKDPLTFSDSGH